MVMVHRWSVEHDCNVGISDRECLAKNVVYSRLCSLSQELYVGKTEWPVWERFPDHYREVQAMAEKAPLGNHH